ncbi:MAG: hypothetical protein AB7I19_02020 [Planctomycetota bacterium]
MDTEPTTIVARNSPPRAAGQRPPTLELLMGDASPSRRGGAIALARRWRGVLADAPFRFPNAATVELPGRQLDATRSSHPTATLRRATVHSPFGARSRRFDRTSRWLTAIGLALASWLLWVSCR